MFLRLKLLLGYNTIQCLPEDNRLPTHAYPKAFSQPKKIIDFLNDDAESPFSLRASEPVEVAAQYEKKVARA